MYRECFVCQEGKVAITFTAAVPALMASWDDSDPLVKAFLESL